MVEGGGGCGGEVKVEGGGGCGGEVKVEGGGGVGGGGWWRLWR